LAQLSSAFQDRDTPPSHRIDGAAALGAARRSCGTDRSCGPGALFGRTASVLKCSLAEAGFAGPTVNWRSARRDVNAREHPSCHCRGDCRFGGTGVVTGYRGRTRKSGRFRSLFARSPAWRLPLRSPLLVLSTARLLPPLQFRLLGAARRNALPLSLPILRPQ